MKVKVNVKAEVEAKTIRLHCKVRDCFDARVVDAEGQVLKEYEGYVPGFFPGEHYGDYLILDIDVDTGQITNWKAPTPAQLEGFINEEED